MAEHTKKGRRENARERGIRRAKKSAEVEPPGEANPGTPTTFYEPMHHPWARGARKLAKAGWSARKIAKRFDVSVDEVKEVLR